MFAMRSAFLRFVRPSRARAAGIFLLSLFCVQFLTISGAAAQSSGAIVQKNVPYVDGGGDDQKMDLYLPAQSGFPIILYIHGGSLVLGDRKDWPLDAIGRNFARAGVGFAAMSYRLGTGHDWPAMVEDAAAAVAWLKTNIGPYGGDASNIFVFGHSSGAFIAANLCLDERYLHKFGLSLDDLSGCIPMGTVLNPSKIFAGTPEDKLLATWKWYRSVRNYFGLFPSAESFREADPSNHIVPGAPAILVLMADTERYQPPILPQANRFADEMKTVGVPVEIMVIPNRNHLTALYGMANPNDPGLLKILGFVRDLAGPAAAGGSDTPSADSIR